jgi:hypothetical protein
MTGPPLMPKTGDNLDPRPLKVDKQQIAANPRSCPNQNRVTHVFSKTYGDNYFFPFVFNKLPRWLFIFNVFSPARWIHRAVGNGILESVEA